MADALLSALRNNFIEQAASDIARLFSFGGGGGGGGGLLATIGSIFGGGRAFGGPIMPGKSYLVGERGPEIIQSQAHAQVIPKDQIAEAGGPSINQTINVPLAFPPQLEAFVRNVAGPAGRDAAMSVILAQHGRMG